MFSVLMIVAMSVGQCSGGSCGRSYGYGGYSAIPGYSGSGYGYVYPAVSYASYTPAGYTAPYTVYTAPQASYVQSYPSYAVAYQATNTGSYPTQAGSAPVPMEGKTDVTLAKIADRLDKMTEILDQVATQGIRVVQDIPQSPLERARRVTKVGKPKIRVDVD